MRDSLDSPGSRAVLQQPGMHMGVNAPTWPAARPEVEHEPRIVDDEAAEIERLIQARQEARKRRDFAEGDRIRDEIAARGIILEDTPQGTRWKRR